jgi:hypothetical protein
MLIQLNNQFEHYGAQKYIIDNVIATPFIKDKDADMLDCTASAKKKTSSIVSSDIMSTSNTADLSSGEGSGERATEHGSNFSKVMYERWQKAN